MKRKKKHGFKIPLMAVLLCILVLVLSVAAGIFLTNTDNARREVDEELQKKVEDELLETPEETDSLEPQETEQEEETTAETGAEEQEENKLTEGMEVHFIDVGQGDAALILQGEHAVLIDTGSSEAKQDILAYLQAVGIVKLDYMILSHGHEDHMGRGCDILEQFPVQHVICDFGNDEGYVQRLETYLKDTDTDTAVAQDGDVYKVGDIVITVLAGRMQEITESDEQVTNVNNQSIAVKVEYRGQSFLFYGDGESEMENLLLQNPEALKTDVLKVAHHGGATSGTEMFLDAAQPRYAVISSAAQEEFGFPTDEVLTRLALRQITTFTTNKRGTVIAVCDGNSISWKCEK